MFYVFVDKKKKKLWLLYEPEHCMIGILVILKPVWFFSCRYLQYKALDFRKHHNIIRLFADIAMFSPKSS